MKWMSSDPLLFAAGDANLAHFESGRVINVVDPSGLEVITAPNSVNFGQTIFDFFDGGESNTYEFNYPHPLAARLLQNPMLQGFVNWYKNEGPLYCKGRKCSDPSSHVDEGEVSFTASSSDFVNDILTEMGAYGEGFSFGDFGINALGSFTLKYRGEVDCSKHKISLHMTAMNDWSIQSLTRNPFTREPLLAYEALNRVHTNFNYWFERSF